MPWSSQVPQHEQKIRWRLPAAQAGRSRSSPRLLECCSLKLKVGARIDRIHSPNHVVRVKWWHRKVSVRAWVPCTVVAMAVHWPHETSSEVVGGASGWYPLAEPRRELDLTLA